MGEEAARVGQIRCVENRESVQCTGQRSKSDIRIKGEVMRRLDVLRVSACMCGLFSFASIFGAPAAKAQCKGNDTGTWYMNAGAENPDEGKQADAFLPNKIWICQGDSIEWTFVPKNEPHTVTFLSQSGAPTAAGSVLDVAHPGPPVFLGADLPPVFTTANFTDMLVFNAPTFTEGVRPSATPPVGPPNGGCGEPNPVTPDSPVPTVGGSPTTCVTSAPLNGGATYTIKFTTPGTYKLVCLVHTNMNGVVHVLVNGSTLPYNQFQYNSQARDQARDVLESDRPPDIDDVHGKNVVMGGNITATGGGRHYLALTRFFPGTINVHKGDTVEWTNLDPTEPHTVTFGTELCGGNCPQVPLNVSMGLDGALSGIVTSTVSSLTSGFLQAAPEDAVGRAQSAPGITIIRITFPNEGTFKYFCALHDTEGMVGTVVVGK